MKKSKMQVAIAAVLFLAATFSFTAHAQQAPVPEANPARKAIEVRKAVFVLIANNFKPIGDTLQGKTPYDTAEIQKRAAHVAFLADLVGDSFPEVSNTGQPDTKAKPEVWSDRAGFDKKVADFREHAAALVKVSAAEPSTSKTASDAFKTAAAAVGQDCKGCHEAYKVK